VQDVCRLAHFLSTRIDEAIFDMLCGVLWALETDEVNGLNYVREARRLSHVVIYALWKALAVM